MVHGIDVFKTYFLNHTTQYVFIGGTACSILMSDLGVDFRATKDLDMVLIVEALDASFGKDFWRFIEDGGYENRQKSSGGKQFYRFSNPENSDFPKMIELFSKHPIDFELTISNGLTPIHIDDSVISLSAILLNDDYYEILVKSQKILDGFSLIDTETIILFKIRAWVDLTDKKNKGEQIDSKNIKKHKNDVFRLLNIVSPNTKYKINSNIHSDINIFINAIQDEKPDLSNLNLATNNINDLINLLKTIYIES